MTPSPVARRRADARRLARAGELRPRERRAGREGLHLLVAHVAGRPAEAAVRVDVELLRPAHREHAANARRHLLGALRVEALDVDHPRAQLAVLAVLLPQIQLGELAARELE